MRRILPPRPIRYWSTNRKVSMNSQALSALLDYATHRLLWSWYRRDRDAQTRSDDPDWENDERTDRGTGSDVDTDEHERTVVTTAVPWPSISQSPAAEAEKTLPGIGSTAILSIFPWSCYT